VHTKATVGINGNATDLAIIVSSGKRAMRDREERRRQKEAEEMKERENEWFRTILVATTGATIIKTSLENCDDERQATATNSIRCSSAAFLIRMQRYK